MSHYTLETIGHLKMKEKQFNKNYFFHHFVCHLFSWLSRRTGYVRPPYSQETSVTRVARDEKYLELIRILKFRENLRYVVQMYVYVRFHPGCQLAETARVLLFAHRHTSLICSTSHWRSFTLRSNLLYESLEELSLIHI